MIRFARCARGFLLVVLALLVPSTAFAGEIDAHLAATYYLARKAGFRPAEAREIAIGDWSMDLNSTTTAYDDRVALPDVDAPPVYRMRGKTFHSLCGTPEAVVAQLGVLRDGIANREGRKRLIAIGQYLHALQDSFFHQTEDGKPFNPEVGHALVPGTDKIALHYDAALHANEFTLEALKALHEDGTPVVPSASEIYFRDRSGLQFSPGHFAKLQKDDAANDLVTMTRVIADSYEIRHKIIRRKMRGEWEETEVEEVGELDYLAMNKKLSELWVNRNNGGSLAPPGEIGWDSPEKILYDTHPDWLILEAPEDPAVTSAKAAGRAIADDTIVGGISFTRAAALSLPIDLDIDSAHVEKGVVVLSGLRGNASRFDAALFLTALRLACIRDDPSFSLDPVDGGAFMNESVDIIHSVATRFVPRILASEEPAAAATDGDPATGLTEVTGPDLQTFDLREKDPALAKELIDDHPEMRAKLVFHPDWLRRTRLGETMYRGDLLLKELTLGIAVLDREGGVPAHDVRGYHPALESMATDALLALLQGSASDRELAAYRFWFEISHDPSAPSVPSPQSLLPDKSLEGNVSAELRDAMAGRTQMYIDSTVLDAHLAVDSVAPRIPRAGGSLDLTDVRPQIFVRRHDAARGEDLAGSERHLDRLATTVNGNLGSYEAKYPDVGALEASLRAYVAALRIAQVDPEACDGLDDLPLLPAEQVATALPETIVPVLAVTIAKIRAASASDSGEVHVAAGMLNGGVSLGARRSLVKAYDPSGSDLTSIVTREAAAWKTQPAAWSSEGREFFALRDDLGAIGSERREIARYRVRPETVDAIVRGDRASIGLTKTAPLGLIARSLENPISALAAACLAVATIWGLGLLAFTKLGGERR